ncbi:hypothetical protein RI578_39460 [Streptomyces sp. BB1-1-1]|uniref:hypothetical protein n=1 Tax=Streptomyces sp. BB1-1-1 TaxID=3074430 RepID=UPI0028772D69|nr:hypothetical protein [Streptomyces sp. BB1-1-1]WND39978.1 hypothetical protein RI578_39460 [Streptomyces sp. BB1-1-1]
MKARLSDMEGPQTVDVHVDRLHLVAQQHDGARIAWQSLAQVSLKGVDDEAFLGSLEVATGRAAVRQGRSGKP